MKKLLTSFAILAACFAAGAQDFDTYFEDATLRLDYVLCGGADNQAVYFQQASKTSGWAGRRQHMDELLLEGNGQIRLRSLDDGKVLYANSFSTLFQEWQSIPEASQVQKAFENCFQVPFPKEKVEVEVTLTNARREVCATFHHVIDPADILIRRIHDNGNPCITVWEGGSLEKAIDIVIVAEGYTAEEKAKFFSDARRLEEGVFSHEPFASRHGDFNVRAVFAESQGSGASVPREGEWHDTAVSCHYDTFYSDRYLTTSSMQKLYDLIGTVPFEHVIVLVNTPRYGGGGVFNSVTIASSNHPTANIVLVHEFGHSFAGLADEYAYDNYGDRYPEGIEPWEPNVTTLTDFASKWEDMLEPGTPVPTPVDQLEQRRDIRRIWNTLPAKDRERLNLHVGVYEGAAYNPTGVFRPVQECRMRMNECEHFCPVCSRAIQRTIDFYTR